MKNDFNQIFEAFGIDLAASQADALPKSLLKCPSHFDLVISKDVSRLIKRKALASDSFAWFWIAARSFSTRRLVSAYQHSWNSKMERLRPNFYFLLLSVSLGGKPNYWVKSLALKLGWRRSAAPLTINRGQGGVSTATR